MRVDNETRRESRSGPSCAVTNLFISGIELLGRQPITRKPLAATSALVNIHNEESEKNVIRSQFTPLTYMECFAAAIKHRARLSLIVIVAKNHDATLFSTDSSGIIYNQVFHYPAESDQIFGACDCLRYRNTYKLCEHLAFIALTEFFSSTFESTIASARFRAG